MQLSEIVITSFPPSPLSPSFMPLSLPCRHPAYRDDDQLLWRPGVLPVQEVEEFLLNAQKLCIQEWAVWTQGVPVQDNEQVHQSDIISYSQQLAV